MLDDVADRRRERDPPHAEVVEGEVEDRVQDEVPERDEVGIQFDCRLKNARFSISIVPLKTRPGAERGERAGDDGRLAGRASAPRWKRMRMIGSASTALTTAAGASRNAIWRRPLETVSANAAQVAARREARERREEHGRDRDGEHPLRQHVDEERLLDRGRRERSGR